jgi:hypothetical protein
MRGKWGNPINPPVMKCQIHLLDKKILRRRHATGLSCAFLALVRRLLCVSSRRCLAGKRFEAERRAASERGGGGRHGGLGLGLELEHEHVHGWWRGCWEALWARGDMSVAVGMRPPRLSRYLSLLIYVLSLLYNINLCELSNISFHLLLMMNSVLERKKLNQYINPKFYWKFLY